MGISNPKPKLALIAGPTASGKTALALHLGKVARCRDHQRRQRAGLCRFASAERAANCRRANSAPHRLFGYLDGHDTPCSAARWAADAKLAIARSAFGGAIPVLVGGTGLYRANAARRHCPDSRGRCGHCAPKFARCRLRMPMPRCRQKDPKAVAATLAPADSSRITRALGGRRKHRAQHR